MAQYIMAGDFNAHSKDWSRIINNPRGHIIKDIIKHNKLIIKSIENPTFNSTSDKSSSNPDFMLLEGNRKNWITFTSQRTSQLVCATTCQFSMLQILSLLLCTMWWGEIYGNGTKQILLDQMKKLLTFMENWSRITKKEIHQKFTTIWYVRSKTVYVTPNLIQWLIWIGL